jgi:subtilisin-like proprotein convertase family protein/subtilisin family serine protease
MTRRNRRSTFVSTFRKTLWHESLENRYLLASDLVVDAFQSQQPLDRVASIEGKQAVARGNAQGKVSADVQLRLPKVEPQDTPFVYIASGNLVGLTTRPGEIAIQIDPSASVDFSGLQFVRDVTPNVYVFSAVEAGSFEFDTAIASRPGIESVSPVFVYPPTDTESVLLDEIIVALEPEVDADTFFADNPNFVDFQPLRGTPDQFVATVRNGVGTATLAIANEMASVKGVRWAAPNFYTNYQRFYTPDDPRLGNQWHLENTGQGGGLVDADSDLPEAWDTNPGGDVGIVVGVIDDGVATNHPDLLNWVNIGEIAGDGIDNDGNGWIDDVNGWNFVNNNANSQPTTASDNHGTAVSGVAAARGDNGIGVVGPSYNSPVISGRIFDGNSVASEANIAQALYYMGGRTANGLGTWDSADVVNNSWGGGGASTAIDNALIWGTTQGREGLGVNYLFATGNGFSPALSNPAASANTIPGVIAVGATNNRGERSNYSNYGTGLDFVTPSNDSRAGYLAIDTTDRVSSAGYSSSDYTGTGGTGFGGTSSATPLATGITALVLDQLNDEGVALTPATLREYLRSTTDLIGGAEYDIASGWNFEFGYGRLNAARAVEGVGVPQISVVTSTFEIEDAVTVVDIGETAVGTSIDYVLRVRNQGTSTLDLNSLVVDSGPFSIASTFANNSLEIGESTNFTVRFTPLAGGSATGQLSIGSNDIQEPSFRVPLSAFALVASVTGLVYEDHAGNATHDAADPSESGRVVFIDTNNNGLRDASNDSFSNTDPVTIPDNTTVNSSITVSGQTTPVATLVVELNIQHTYLADLDLVLVSPTGTRVALASAVGGSDSNMIETIFDDSAAVAINEGSAPFTGSFRPEEALSGLSGETANGAWTLEVTDNASQDTGQISNWTLSFLDSEPITLTGSAGSYAFFNLPVGEHTIRLETPSGWTSLEGSDGYAIDIEDPSDSVTSQDFGIAKNDRAYGNVFDDANADGSRQSSESKLPGETLFIDVNQNGIFDGPVQNTFSNTTPVQIIDNTAATSTINVAGLDGGLQSIELKLDVTHTFTGDLVGKLIGPDGTEITLFFRIGGSGDNFTDTIFTDTATNSITSGSAPFTGSFRPVEPLAIFQSLADANGLWQLEIDDRANGDEGSINSWELTLVTGVEESFETQSNGNFQIDLPSGDSDLALQLPVGWVYTNPLNGFLPQTTNGEPQFGQAFGIVENNVPVLGADNASITGTEGDDLSNTGTWSDSDDPYANLSVSATAGDVSLNADGTWDWSLSTTDQLPSTTVLITIDDGRFGISETEFEFEVENAAPTLTIDNSALVGGVTQAAINSGTWSDVAADIVTLTSSAGSITKNDDGSWDWTYSPTIAESIDVTITASDEDGGSTSDSFSFEAIPVVVGSGVFYENATGSNFDSSGGAEASRDTSKVPLRPGQSSSFANYTNYYRGLNGLIIDVGGLPASSSPAEILSNLDFATWNAIDDAGFVSLPTEDLPAVEILSGAGSDGSTRVKLTFADNAVENTWLRTTIKAGSTTGLAADDVFYFGNVIGEMGIGNTSTRLRVNAADTIAVRTNQSIFANSVGPTNRYDVNRDGRVNAADTILVRVNQEIFGIVAPLDAPASLPPFGGLASGATAGSGQSTKDTGWKLDSPTRLDDDSRTNSQAARELGNKRPQTERSNDTRKIANSSGVLKLAERSKSSALLPSAVDAALSETTDLESDLFSTQL